MIGPDSFPAAVPADLPADLAEVPAALSARGVVLGSAISFAAVTGSTNDDAKQAAKEGAPHGAVWLADEQASGRGRQGRAWHAAPGESLLLSVLIRATCTVQRLPTLSIAVGLAVRDAVDRVLAGVLSPDVVRPRVGLKWPNDVLVDGKKLAGILVESVLSGREVHALVAGVGVNVHTAQFPEELANRATSLAQVASACGASVDAAAASRLRGDLLVEMLAALEGTLPLVMAKGLGPLRSRLEAADVLRGRVVQSELGAGVAAGIDDDGRLLVRDAFGALHRWSSGEVHLGTG